MLSAAQRILELTQLPSTEKPKIALDTNCVQYYISNPPSQPWADCLDPIFRAGVEGKVDLYVSTVVVSELLSHVHFQNRRNQGYDPELALLALLNRHFKILDVDDEVARAAGRLRGGYAPNDKVILKTPDALIAATSMANAHTLFVTNDFQLANALPTESRIYLREAAVEWLIQWFPISCIATTGLAVPIRRGRGLPAHVTMGTLELGSVKPPPSTSWRRILGEAFTAASALNEPCVFILLTHEKGRGCKTVEMLFWHEALEHARPVARMLDRIEKHLGYSRRTGTAGISTARAHCFCFSSLQREQARQSQPSFDSKSEQQRIADGWKTYLTTLWRFRRALVLPNLDWLLCEDGVARSLRAPDALEYLNLAKNVLGLEDGP